MRSGLKPLKRETDSSRAAASSRTEAASPVGSVASLSGLHSPSPVRGATPVPGSGAAQPAHGSSSAVVAAVKQHPFGGVEGGLAGLFVPAPPGFSVFSLLP